MSAEDKTVTHRQGQERDRERRPQGAQTVKHTHTHTRETWVIETQAEQIQTNKDTCWSDAVDSKVPRLNISIMVRLQ